MNLNAPDLSCAYCKGKGARVRSLHMVVNGQVLSATTTSALHCGCLSPELKALHEGLDKEDILRDWPWDELKDLKIPRVEGGPEPKVVSCPFPVFFNSPFTPAKAAPEPAPKKKEPAPEKPQKRRGRSKS
jgi:hypothetical protein